MKLIFLISLLFFNSSYSIGQKGLDSIKIISDKTLTKLDSIIKKDGEFNDAVFLVEQSFSQNNTAKNNFTGVLKTYKLLAERGLLNIASKGYKKTDSLNYFTNIVLNNILTQEVKTTIGGFNITLEPFTYNFADPQGDKDWTNTFVTKLLTTHKGNCRSLTYLYKILADELGAKCWLALAPNHIYIRNYSKQIGWYNTELTSGTFPTDAWIAATGYVNTDAIRSSVYMDTLSNQQSIGLCIMDLAQGYIKQTNNYTDSFVLKCCNLVLQYHSVNPEALLTKAEALKRMYLKQKEENNPTAHTTYEEMEQTYITLVKLGYREMPYKTYQKWLKTAKQDKEKYQNQRLNATLNKH
ncbi:MAG: hypothetical protein ACKVOM_13960 [Ferruginibacter sp.]